LQEVALVNTHSHARVAFRQAKILQRNDVLKKHLDEYQFLQNTLLDQRVAVENRQLVNIERADNKALQKHQAADLKRHPKLLKQNETLMKRMFTDTMKSEAKMFMSETMHQLEALPKDQKEATLKTKKHAHEVKLAEEELKLKQSIQSKNEEQTGALETRLKAERDQLQREHQLDAMQLHEFQTFRLEAVHERQAKEQAKLKEDCATAIKEGLAYQEAERLRCCIEAERITKLKDTSAKELDALQEAPPTQFIIA
jgi:hypothetical protein